MRFEIFLIFIGMTLVTYIPRAIPVIFINRIKLSKKVEKFLLLIPFTAMSSLIFPGILSVDTQRWYIGVVGGIVAGFFAWKKLPIAITVIISIIAVMLMYGIK